jgi:tetratricopeptide (TPR) repeat protein
MRRLGRLADEQWKGLFRGNLLRVTCFAGLVLLLAAGGILTAAYLLGGNTGKEHGDDFYRLLREYDRAEGNGGIPAGPETERLDRELDRLERKAGSVETWLSVLKRRRHLARLDPRYSAACRQSALRARLAYPYSEPLAVFAAAALVRDSAITREAETELRAMLPLLAGGRFSAARLGLHVLLGDFKNPAVATERLPPDLAASAGIALAPAEAAALTADLAMVRLIQGDSAGAAAAVQGGLAAASPPPELLGFAAEFFYDFGDLPRSAELFSRMPGDAALLRQADALWLAGYAGSARTIWSMLATDGETGESDPGAGTRSLYNLALSAENRAGAAALLERLAAAGPETPGREAGRIRYSRLLDAPRAVALLESAAPSALTGLEILRRRTELAGTGRLVTETWLLVGRYPQEEELYRWAAWFFDRQRSYAESALLLKTAARHGFDGRWAAFHRALQLLRDGGLDAAESAFAAIPGDWAAAANLGRIGEAKGAPARALEWYETAAAALTGNSAGEPGDWDQTETPRRRETASRIQYRIALCLRALGRAGESRRALEYALDLNPDNLSARLELGRLGNEERR